jgi:hypothetical protein
MSFREYDCTCGIFKSTLPEHISSPPVLVGIVLLHLVGRCLFFYAFWPLCCLSFFDLRFLIGHCVVCSSIYGFWLAIVLSVLLRFTASDWSLCCLSFFDLRLLIGHCVFSPSSIYRFWLVIVLSVLRFTASDCPLCCLSFDLRLLIVHFVSSIFSGKVHERVNGVNTIRSDTLLYS